MTLPPLGCPESTCLFVVCVSVRLGVLVVAFSAVSTVQSAQVLVELRNKKMCSVLVARRGGIYISRDVSAFFQS